jgi:hypothetical protein
VSLPLAIQDPVWTQATVVDEADSEDCRILVELGNLVSDEKAPPLAHRGFLFHPTLDLVGDCDHV